MDELLTTMLEAHGGLENWDRPRVFHRART